MMWFLICAFYATHPFLLFLFFFLKKKISLCSFIFRFFNGIFHSYIYSFKDYYSIILRYLLSTRRMFLVFFCVVTHKQS
ncbi:hypothetical protein CANARDRAFT_40778 [[Candida] arabinofermentans NRRL YB-2248]|uniref:Uncharacterized protein n=1 Tax=[Candida] arabinofermentans NRRL YB-2248 TaxID=983967 RepID=A0A1E4T7H0_9ASCO|nr:hypothetical protein CANARDRAFT_40778 [[Candida] arabinofermentans NRRL YB-2248]